MEREPLEQRMLALGAALAKVTPDDLREWIVRSRAALEGEGPLARAAISANMVMAERMIPLVEYAWSIQPTLAAGMEEMHQRELRDAMTVMRLRQETEDL